jgi:molecular chaperone HtpG
METFEFQTEAKQLLDLMIHSIYSNKDIFLRELISNSSDALDKIRIEALTNKKIQKIVTTPEIWIESDKEKRTLTVRDNGIGMSRQELIDYVGTIAKSGTQDFLKILKENKDKAISPELIGQFGVGLYSCFMAAEKITIDTLKAGEEKATRLVSTGDGTYTLEDIKKDQAGTSVTLELKEEDSEDGLHDYTSEWKIREIVKKYSDYVSHPIMMKVERKEIERDEKGKPVEGAEEKTIITDETLNSMKAIWVRSSKDVTDDEYNEFYKHISHDWTDPLARISFKAEGRFEFRGLLFIPSKAPFDLFMRDSKHGIHLYIKRVFIMNDCKELIPEYMRFMRGVVDSEDLSLNISREILQKNRQIEVIRKHVTGKILDKLQELKEKENEKYLTFWKECGRVFREGLFQDMKNREKIFDICLFSSTNSDDELTDLAGYIERMKDGQENIYYMTGKSRESIENSPHLEAFKEKGYEVLFLTEAVDEIWVQSAFQYKEKTLKSIGKGSVELGSEEEKKKEKEEREEKEKEYKSLLDAIKGKLEDNIKEVRLSSRLRSSPVCLVGDVSDMSPQMEDLMRASGQELPKIKRILELNPTHPILVKLQEIYEKNALDPLLGEYAELLYGQALLAEGNQPADPGKFSKTIAELMIRALK